MELKGLEARLRELLEVRLIRALPGRKPEDIACTTGVRRPSRPMLSRFRRSRRAERLHLMLGAMRGCAGTKRDWSMDCLT
jgi:hypothetical protein